MTKLEKLAKKLDVSVDYLVSDIMLNGIVEITPDISNELIDCNYSETIYKIAKSSLTPVEILYRLFNKYCINSSPFSNVVSYICKNPNTTSELLDEIFEKK